MSKYIDLVLCHSEGTNVLAEAPSFPTWEKET